MTSSKRSRQLLDLVRHSRLSLLPRIEKALSSLHSTCDHPTRSDSRWTSASAALPSASNEPMMKRFGRSTVVPAFLTLALPFLASIACHSTQSDSGTPKDPSETEAREGDETADGVQDSGTEREVAPALASYTAHIPGADPPTPFEMVWIEEGGFWIGKTEVTWDEYLRYCNFDRQETLPEDLDAVTRPSKPLETFPYDFEWGKGRRPAVGMSWNAAKKYCEWLSVMTGHRYRLPTEGEWLLAAGEAPEGSIEEYAWYIDNSDEKTQEVGQKKPNEHGLHDVLGNLWEYTADPFDPAEPQWAALRGGSWEQDADELSPAARLQFDEFWTMDDSNNPPGVWWVPEGYHLGFRVLREGPVTTSEGN